MKTPLTPVGELATIYVTSEFMGNVNKIECKLIQHGKRPYAQYDDATFVYYIPKGKRNQSAFVKGYKPYVLILKGHGHPSPEELFSVSLPPSSTGLKSSTSKYMSFDDRYKTDFDAVIDGYLTEKPDLVIADYRCTKG